MNTRRRGRGEGSIVQRADGRWMGRVNLGWQNGKRRYKTIYAKTRRLAAESMTRALRAAQDGTLRTDERQTVAQFLTSWLQDVARARVRSRTFDTYEAAVHRHIVPHLGQQSLAKLTPQHAQTWLADLEAQGVPVGRRRYARAVLRAALNTAMRWGLVRQNVATLVDAPRVDTREIRPMTPEEAKRLLAAAEGHVLQGFVAVALGCGLRLGEALGLKWGDIDLDAGTLRVCRALQRCGGDAGKRRPLLAERRRLLRALKAAAPGTFQADRDRLTAVRAELCELKTSVQLVEPKSVRSRRSIALPAITIAALRSHRKRQLETRLAVGAAWQEQGFVFTTPIGTPADPHNLHKLFKTLLAGAELPPMRIHDLRHSCASLLLAQGVDPRTIMETLGHSQISLTLNTYAHVLPSLRHEAAAKMNAILTR